MDKIFLYSLMISAPIMCSALLFTNISTMILLSLYLHRYLLICIHTDLYVCFNTLLHVADGLHEMGQNSYLHLDYCHCDLLLSHVIARLMIKKMTWFFDGIADICRGWVKPFKTISYISTLKLTCSL